MLFNIRVLRETQGNYLCNLALVVSNSVQDPPEMLTGYSDNQVPEASVGVQCQPMIPVYYESIQVPEAEVYTQAQPEILVC